MSRQLVPGVHWLQECVTDLSYYVDGDNPSDWYEPGEEVHIPRAFI